MDNVFIIINLPLYEQKFEIIVPISKKVGSLKRMVIQGINELNSITIKSPTSFLLIDKENGHLFDENKTIYENGINNGTEIILF